MGEKLPPRTAVRTAARTVAVQGKAVRGGIAFCHERERLLEPRGLSRRTLLLPRAGGGEKKIADGNPGDRHAEIDRQGSPGIHGNAHRPAQNVQNDKAPPAAKRHLDLIRADPEPEHRRLERERRHDPPAMPEKERRATKILPVPARKIVEPERPREPQRLIGKLFPRVAFRDGGGVPLHMRKHGERGFRRGSGGGVPKLRAEQQPGRAQKLVVEQRKLVRIRLGPCQRRLQRQNRRVERENRVDGQRKIEGTPRPRRVVKILLRNLHQHQRRALRLAAARVRVKPRGKPLLHGGQWRDPRFANQHQPREKNEKEREPGAHGGATLDLIQDGRKQRLRGRPRASAYFASPPCSGFSPFLMSTSSMVKRSAWFGPITGGAFSP